MSSLNLIKIIATSSGLTTASTAYVDGDLMGAEMQFDMGSNTYGGIVSAVIHDASDIIGTVDLMLSDRSVTLGTDNVAPSGSDADELFGIPPINFPFPLDMGGNRRAFIDSIFAAVNANASGIIYGRLITRSGHTFFGAATALQVDLYISNDV